MSDTAELVPWLRAQLDEDERIARAAGYPDPERWVAEGDQVLNTYLRQTATAWKRETGEPVRSCGDGPRGRGRQLGRGRLSWRRGGAARGPCRPFRWADLDVRPRMNG